MMVVVVAVAMSGLAPVLFSVHTHADTSKWLHWQPNYLGALGRPLLPLQTALACHQRQ